MTKKHWDHDKHSGQHSPEHNQHKPEDSATNEELRELEHLSYQELEAKLNEADAKTNQYYDQLLRTQAEIENIRRRSEREISNIRKYGQEDLISGLVEIVDNLERGLAGATDTQEGLVKSLRDGMELTLTMLLKTLEKYGLKQVNPLGAAFNPEQQQAVATKQDPKVAPNTVIEVLQKGYLLHDRLLRPALVVVAKG